MMLTGKNIQEFDETILAASGLLVCLHSSPHSIVNAYFLQQFYIEMWVSFWLKTELQNRTKGFL